jgi:prepilin-type N-terminal cleavage/methylation domain-containing protein/prepilin-type processing-associated H-X9-DG protein
MKRGKAFTLVELLVVIAIIAILTSLLLPAIRKVRHSALMVVEQSNMRQVGVAVCNYAVDHQGDFVGAAGGTSSYVWSTGDVRRKLYNGHYLKADWVQIPQDGDGPTSRVWGCPMVFTSNLYMRYEISWWWGPSQQETCDVNGKVVYLRQKTTEAWNTETSYPRSDFYRLKITGSGFSYDNPSPKTTSGRKRVLPQDIVILTDRGVFQSTTSGSKEIRGFPPNHLRYGAAPNITNIEGSNTLFLDGHTAWRTRNQLNMPPLVTGYR